MIKCEIVQRYDMNNNGTIDMGELFGAIDDVGEGLTESEFEHVRAAYTMGEGGVAAACPPETIPGDEDGDYPVTEKDAMAVFKTFVVAAVLAYVVIKIIWG